MTSIQRLVRRQEVQYLLGDICETQLKELRRSGVVPQPDVWLGPRSPAWFESTIAKVIDVLARQPRPTARRGKRSEKTERRDSVAVSSATA